MPCLRMLQSRPVNPSTKRPVFLSRFKRILKFMQTQYLSFNDFLADVSIKYEHQKNDKYPLRYGQMYFNLLEEFRPALAIKLRESLYDPYYSVHEEIPETHAFVESNW